MQAFHDSAQQGLLRMYAARYRNQTAPEFTEAKAHIVRTALTLVRARVKRLSYQDGDACLQDPLPAGVLGGDKNAVDGVLQMFYAVRERLRSSRKGVKNEGVVEKQSVNGMSVQKIVVNNIESGVSGEEDCELKCTKNGWECKNIGDEVLLDAGVGLFEDADFDEEVDIVLKDLDAVDLQRSVEGEQCVWILKASNSSKGIGIKLFDTLSQVTRIFTFLAKKCHSGSIYSQECVQ